MSFSSAAPSGYLDFTNATPKAIKMIATSNIGVGTTVPAYALDVHGSANVGALHMTLPVTDIASNLVTYDKNTGQLFDSGGLFSNKLTVVSPHPPSAMSSDTTVITDHGTYVSAASSSATDVYAWQAFNETTSSYWETPPSYMGASNVYNGGSTQLASSTELGEWLTIEVPNEMTLRHIEVTPRTIASYPGSANLYATNDSVTWTEVKNWENVVPTDTSSQQIAVNATSAYKKYGMVTTKVSGNSSNLAIANLKLFGESLTFDNGHLSVTGLPMATVASNLVTYDKTTGKFFDSAGLFSNKLAVVSVQPPEALTGASTVVTGHGTYTIESPGVDAYKLFDKDDTTTWTGENVTVNLPYKTTLRYLKMMADTFSGTVTVEASHTDGLTWTTLVSGATTAETVLVNATQPYKKYKFSFGSSITLKTLDLFTESFSIDGGKVAMAQQPTTGGETVMDQHGPHGRDGAAKLKKYPEIAFISNEGVGGTYDRYLSSTAPFEGTFIQAGYIASSSSNYSGSVGAGAWNLFAHRNSEPTDNYSWYSQNATNYNGTVGGNYSYSGTKNLGTGAVDGEWVKIEMPEKIRLKKYTLWGADLESEFPQGWTLYGSDNGTSWASIHSKDGQTIGSGSWSTTSSSATGKFVNLDVTSSDYYKYFALVFTRAGARNDYIGIGEWELYGYEEDPPLGDTSVDTTFTSIMNTPQTTGAQVYVDGSLGETFTNRVTGPDATGPSATYDATGKYWELNGELTSNLSVEANTFLSGDAPHSLSMWFNSSNLEANVSNTCVFSISDQEKLDSVNLDLQSNTWHNLTYAYQGEGGSRVTYLDGRKVAEDQAEDTFGDYPPFAMTGYSQGGYVVSASGEYNTTEYNAWKAFDGDTTSEDNSFITPNDSYSASGATKGNYLFSNAITDNTSTVHRGEWIKMEFPHKLVINSVKMDKRPYASADLERMLPAEFAILGSNNDQTWYLIHNRTGIATNAPTGTHFVSTGNYKTKGFKYVVIVLKKASSNADSNEDHIAIGEITFYGHRENDLVRLPDPTNVLKYPHIAMTGPAQRGYVASESSAFSSAYVAYKLFDGDETTGISAWESTPNGSSSPYATSSPGSGTNFGYATNGNAATTTLGDSSTVPGEWIQMKFPHKILVNSVDIMPQTTLYARMPGIAVFLGSNTGNNDWVTLATVNKEGQTYAETVYSSFTVNATTAYSYIRIVWKTTHTQGSTGRGRASAHEIRFFGTEEASPVPIQIGGGNIDKVANFRVYDKFVGEDQALEIWDAQKDEFGRAKSSMTLQKGRLGIGTDEPQGRLAVLDEPDATTYGLQEFPPKPLVGYKTHIEGHGEFCVSESESAYSGGTNYNPWYLFTKQFFAGSWQNSTWNTQSVFDTGNGLITTSDKLGNFPGTWVQLQLPYKIKLEKITISVRGAWFEFGPEDYVIVAYDEDTTSWIELASYIGETWNNIGDVEDIKYKPINSTSYYRKYAIVVSRLYNPNNNRSDLNIAEWRLFGYREQVTKQSVLHDGQLTLTKNLNVPRIGPALDADDTPRRDRLVVEYNTSTNPTFEGAVRDTSGRGNDGAFYDGASYDATKKALDFDGTNDYVRCETLHNFKGGNITYGVSMWINLKRFGDANGSAVGYIYTIGNVSSAGQKTFVYVRQQNTGENPAYQLLLAGYSYDFPINKNNWDLNRWYHIVVGYGGTTFKGVNLHAYVDGVNVGTLADNASNGGDAGAQLNIAENPRLTLAKNHTEHFSGYISNFKLYDTVLTAEEVKTLYDMGRCDEGGHVVNFSKTRVGIGLGDGETPRSALDVRDLIYAESSSVQTFTGQHICFPDESMETGLIVSAKKNKFVKLNGLATGKSAITIDESLPIVSLSNVAQDKACFGVVSAMEESNAAYRTEITGGLVSESVKIAGDNRAIVNSVGEGAIWVVDTGGALESGDYITTSNVAGYGQKQAGAGLMNYTVAKITMDCDFTGSNVAVQTIKREETGLQTIMEDTWNQLVDYDRSSNTETQYSNTLAPSAYSDQPGYVPREVTTIVDYTDGSNLISVAEWSNLESNIQNTYQSNTFTEIVDYTKFVSLGEWSNLTPETQNTYSEAEITTYYQIQRGGNVLDENGQLQFEDKTGATEAPYERRFLDASGAQTDEANAVHIAAFVGCTYHCG